jgi:hypothetical protein
VSFADLATAERRAEAFTVPLHVRLRARESKPESPLGRLLTSASVTMDGDEVIASFDVG